MTRRDIIIIAVLANIGVLALLFMLAFRTDDEKVSDQPEIALTIEEQQPVPQSATQPTEVELTKSEPTDEIDLVIEEATPINHSTSVQSSDDEPVVPDVDVDQPVSAPAVPESSEPASESNPRFVEVTVKSGDALEKIARANGTTVDAIKKVNKLTTDKLKIGQVLKVPVGTKKSGAATAAKKAAAKPIASGEAQYYTMKNGDNPWKIAKQFHLKLDDLLKLNNLDEDSARKLKPGDQIRVN